LGTDSRSSLQIPGFKFGNRKVRDESLGMGTKGDYMLGKCRVAGEDFVCGVKFRLCHTNLCLEMRKLGLASE